MRGENKCKAHMPRTRQRLRHISELLMASTTTDKLCAQADLARCFSAQAQLVLELKLTECWLDSRAASMVHRYLSSPHGGDGNGRDAADDGGARAKPHEAVLQNLFVACLQQRLCLPKLWVRLRGGTVHSIIS